MLALPLGVAAGNDSVLRPPSGGLVGLPATSRNSVTMPRQGKADATRSLASGMFASGTGSMKRLLVGRGSIFRVDCYHSQIETVKYSEVRYVLMIIEHIEKHYIEKRGNRKVRKGKQIATKSLLNDVFKEQWTKNRLKRPINQQSPRIAEQNHCINVFFLHNHPNPNPNYYSYTRPSRQDDETANRWANCLNRNGINLVEFICERGRNYMYYLKVSDFYRPLYEYEEKVRSENGVSKGGNLRLHIQKNFGARRKPYLHR